MISSMYNAELTILLYHSINCTILQYRKIADSILDEVIWFFQLIQSFQPHYGPGVYSASNRNEYQESS
jgi:hypothetical protein